MGYKLIVSEFIKLGADIEARTDDGFTPYLEAVSLGKENIADFLVANGASKNAKTDSGLEEDDLRDLVK